jgi:hypothetical protein
MTSDDARTTIGAMEKASVLPIAEKGIAGGTGALVNPVAIR